jgi:hypothetical protein
MNENARNKTALVVLEEVALAARRAAEQAAEQDDAFANGANGKNDFRRELLGKPHHGWLVAQREC